jgi:hypothetical protein
MLKIFFNILDLAVQHSYELFGLHAVENVIVHQEKTHHNAAAESLVQEVMVVIV